MFCNALHLPADPETEAAYLRGEERLASAFGEALADIASYEMARCASHEEAELLFERACEVLDIYCFCRRSTWHLRNACN